MDEIGKVSVPRVVGVVTDVFECDEYRVVMSDGTLRGGEGGGEREGEGEGERERKEWERRAIILWYLYN